MPEPKHTISIFSRNVSGVSISVGDVVIPESGGTDYVVATSANRGTRGSEGIALTAIGSTRSAPFEMQTTGIIDPEISGLTDTGTKSLVRVSSTGRLERIVSYTAGDDVVGYAEADGRCHLFFGIPWSEIAGGGGGGAVPGGNVGDTQFKEGTADFAGAPFGPPLELFGAVGDGVTDDTTALTAAGTALNAGTYRALQVPTKTYLGEGIDVTTTGKTIRGHGEGSVLKLKPGTNRPAVLLRDAEDSFVSGLRLEGTGKATGLTLQRGVCSGYLGTDGASRVRCSDVTAYNMGDGGFVFQENPEIIGAQLANCRAYECALGFDCLTETSLVGCQAWECTIGLRIAAGNVAWSAGDIIECTTGVKVLGGGNDGHSLVVGANINHCTIAVDCGAISNATTFVACDIYQGAIFANGNTGILHFDNCQIDATIIDCTNGKIRFTNCIFPTAYFVSCTETGTGWIEFVDCVGNDGTIPSFIESRVQRAFTFASDANDTLTWQESVAETLIVASGTISATRNIASLWGPESGRKQRIVNNNAQAVTFTWSSGTAVTIATGEWALVGANGTNAIKLEYGDSAGGSGGAPTDATYVCLSNNGSLSNERVLTAGTNISVTDGGANGNVTVAFSGTLPIANGGTNATSIGANNTVATSNGSAYVWQTIVNANVNASAAIAGTKISPVFGSQNVSTTGAYQQGSTPATTGAISLTNNTGIYWRNAANGNNIRGLFVESTDYVYVANSIAAGVIIGPSGGIYLRAGGTNDALTVLTTGIKTAQPVSGDSTYSVPFRFKVARITAAGDTTLTAAQYECPIIYLDGAASGNYFDVPSSDGGWWNVTNRTAGIASWRLNGAGTVIDIPAQRMAVCWADVTAGRIRGLVGTNAT